VGEPAAELRGRLEAAREEGLDRIAAVHDLASLEEAQVRTLGRKAPLAQARSQLRELSENDRRELGRLANEVHSAFEHALTEKRTRFEAAEREVRWEQEGIDVTLPGAKPNVGGLHPLTRTIWEIVDVFLGLGYRLAEGHVQLRRPQYSTRTSIAISNRYLLRCRLQPGGVPSPADVTRADQGHGGARAADIRSRPRSLLPAR
jgi:phenylalanyl-tRNA synthetase alpha subunit